MTVIFNNGVSLLENKNYYKNVLVKTKYNEQLFNIANIISFLHKEYKIISRFYKIYSFKNDISVDYVYKIMKTKFPSDIINNIIQYYLKDDVSFHSIIDNKGYNTIKFITNIKYSEESDSYETFVDLPLSYKNNVIEDLENIISNNFKKLLNNKINFDINDIFLINDNRIDFSIVHKIYNSNIAWGMI